MVGPLNNEIHQHWERYCSTHCLHAYRHQRLTSDRRHHRHGNSNRLQLHRTAATTSYTAQTQVWLHQAWWSITIGYISGISTTQEHCIRSYGNCKLLWLPYGKGQAIIFLPCGFFYVLSSSFFFSSPNLSRHRLDVYHTSTHSVALARI